MTAPDYQRQQFNVVLNGHLRCYCRTAVRGLLVPVLPTVVNFLLGSCWVIPSPAAVPGWETWKTIFKIGFKLIPMRTGWKPIMESFS